jgi:hypothetical protein
MRATIPAMKYDGYTFDDMTDHMMDIPLTKCLTLMLLDIQCSSHGVVVV